MFVLFYNGMGFYEYIQFNQGLLYGNRVFENKKDKISSLEKVLTKVVRNTGNGNAGI